MKLIRGIHNFSKVPYKCVMTIGNFDGVHRGHRVLLKKLKEEGLSRRLPTLVMIFEPHPLELLFREQAPARLSQLREKLYYLSQCGIDYVLCVRFNWKFAAIPAKAFIRDILVKLLNLQFLIVGDDFHFGANRKGNFLLLKNASLAYGFDVINIQTFYEQGIRISSTAIRQALEEDRLEAAKNFLGYPFRISGRVIHGEKLGRRLGYPTANVALRRQVSPVKGVYVVEVTGIGKTPILGIANVGTRPTVSGIHQRLEVHLLDIDVNLYGCYINIFFLKKIRNEKKFSSINTLKKQIACDKLTAMQFLVHDKHFQMHKLQYNNEIS